MGEEYDYTFVCQQTEVLGIVYLKDVLQDGSWTAKGITLPTIVGRE